MEEVREQPLEDVQERPPVFRREVARNPSPYESVGLETAKKQDDRDACPGKEPLLIGSDPIEEGTRGCHSSVTAIVECRAGRFPA